jgi:hypothetical protein
MDDFGMEADPATLLEYMAMGGEMRDIAMQQLNMSLLLSDNVDVVFQKFPPRDFLPAINKILMDESAPQAAVETALQVAKAYLDVHIDVARKLTAEDGVMAAICGWLELLQQALLCLVGLSCQICRSLLLTFARSIWPPCNTVICLPFQRTPKRNSSEA